MRTGTANNHQSHRRRHCHRHCCHRCRNRHRPVHGHTHSYKCTRIKCIHILKIKQRNCIETVCVRNGERKRWNCGQPQLWWRLLFEYVFSKSNQIILFGLCALLLFYQTVWLDSVNKTFYKIRHFYRWFRMRIQIKWTCQLSIAHAMANGHCCNWTSNICDLEFTYEFSR